MLDLSKIIQQPLPEKNYNQSVNTKTQIFIHHTAGASNPQPVISGWQTRTDRVATAYVIAGKPTSATATFKDGDIFQAFQANQWAYHLGLKKSVFTSLGVPYLPLDKTSIAIEICNWGALTLKADGKYYHYLGKTVPPEEVVKLNSAYRGSKYYHKYTAAQIASVKDLLIYLCDTFKIPKNYNTGMFDISKAALTATPGIWTHTSVRKDKVDCSPQPDLIAMLQTLGS